MPSKIVPSLWFRGGKCEEAIKYYVGIFPDSSIGSIKRYENENLNENFRGMEGKVLTAEFTLLGRSYTALDGTDDFHFTEAVSFQILCKNQEEIDYYWEKLNHVSEKGRCGWCEDRYGLSWQVIPENMMELLSTDEKMKAMLEMKKIIIEDLKKA